MLEPPPFPDDRIERGQQPYGLRIAAPVRRPRRPVVTLAIDLAALKFTGGNQRREGRPPSPETGSAATKQAECARQSRLGNRGEDADHQSHDATCPLVRRQWRVRRRRCFIQANAVAPSGHPE